MADTSIDQLAAAVAMVQLGAVAAADPNADASRVEDDSDASDAESVKHTERDGDDRVQAETGEQAGERKPLEYDDGPLVWVCCLPNCQDRESAHALRLTAR